MTKLYLTQKAWKQIEQAVRSNPEVETGGVLMGYPINDDDWAITYASGPGPRAMQLRHAVMFDDLYLRQLVRKVRRKTFGRVHYIGDWHSHTIRRLSPSRADRQTVYMKAYQEKYASPSPLMLIVGVDKRDDIQARGFILNESLREVQEILLTEKPMPRQPDRKPSSPYGKR
ncbi:Mov34/MPN/PAD-1 family protein [Brevibacillus humidisoli]|uniref:Mov34/MPN/PAD-1 family protein n=1 Tax=Brevibacillus humidisoli TaxID=2895522 RepID=UPI001E548A4C|nr:Mov34/MPN/PAD-1 family protein [Brevibacillus humidisoli]UFJ38972.1 Mov34/MPN/PAD-1 family protein [Brevibacillus humidisoli]